MKKTGIVIGAAAAGTAAAASVEIFFRNFICRREPERWEEREKRKGNPLGTDCTSDQGEPEVAEGTGDGTGLYALF